MTTKSGRKHPLSTRHNKQIGARKTSLKYRMRKFWALTWRPGDSTDTFVGKLYRPLGSPLHLTQHSNMSQHEKRHVEQLPLVGFRAKQDPQTSDVFYGGEDNCRFAYDFAVKPFVGAGGRHLDPKRNPSVIQLGFDMDKAREKAAMQSFKLPDVPALPEVYYAFNWDRMPSPEDTPAARKYLIDSQVMAQMGTLAIEKDEFDALTMATEESVKEMEQQMVMQLITARWEELFVKPGVAGNNTGFFLLHHQFFTRPMESVRTFECFSHLVGTHIYNPVRAIIKPDFKIANPAIAAGKQLGIAVGRAESSDYKPEEVEKLLKVMRQLLGRRHLMVSNETLYAAIDKPFESLIPEGHPNPVEFFGEEEAIRLMRAVMPRHADCCLDADLLEAARFPNRPLLAAGLAKVFVMAAEGDCVGPATLQFSPEDLEADRIHADFWSIPSRWKGQAGAESA